MPVPDEEHAIAQLRISIQSTELRPYARPCQRPPITRPKGKRVTSNLYLEIADAIDAARQRLSLIREGLLPHEGEELVPRWRAPKAPAREQSRVAGHSHSKSVLFHIPATRSYRLTSVAGATSFHFSHRAIGKVTFATCEEGVRVKPGAARAHGRYVERDEAVALLDPALSQSAPNTGQLTGAAADLSLPITNQEHHDHDYTHDHRIDQWLGRGLVEDLSASEPGSPGPAFAGPLLGRPVEDAVADARMWLLPRRDVVRHGSRTHGLLRSAADVSVEAGSEPLGLRQPSSGDLDERARVDTPSLRSRSEASGHDDYIGRAGAVAIQPDGTRALLTNIDADDGERTRFWSLVEEHEAVNRGDKMSLRIGDNPAFWSATAARPDCPLELKTALETAMPNDTVRFDIASGKEMRAFLATQPGWVPPTAKGNFKPFARFHDGRNGRTQYRIVGELPNELDAVSRFGILHEFSQQFSKRKLPFVAVMHAPDHKNDERNWHFHLIYYDRPCRRITQDDIGHLTEQGHRTAHLEPGLWDFAVVTPKKGRSNGKAVPLKQNKVTEVTQDGWIEMLRGELAAITNRHLERGSVERRVDARRYEEMGIVADPQEHLGTDQAAAETRGEATVIGCENESRQWDAIMAEGNARLEAALTAIDTHTVNAGDRGQKDLADETAKRDRLAQVARLQHMAFCLEQDIDRARSRAAAVQRKNRQLLDAYNADLTAGTLRERTQAEQLVAAATSYLAHLDAALGDDVALPALVRDAADQALRPMAGAAEAQGSPTTVSPLAPIYTHPERFSTVSRDDAMIAEAMDAARRRDEERQLVARTPIRSDRAPAREQTGATAERKPSHEGSTSEVARDDAAKRAAIAAALRGHGR